MSHTFTNLLVHATFATKNRVPLLEGDAGPRLFAYMGGIVRELGGNALAVNGPADHVHMQLRLPPTVCVAEVMRVVKTNSSRWAREERLTSQPFGWQAGYGAFSVSESRRAPVLAYIAKQAEHHERMDFKAEFQALLRRHGIAFGPAQVWGQA